MSAGSYNRRDALWWALFDQSRTFLRTALRRGTPRRRPAANSNAIDSAVPATIKPTAPSGASWSPASHTTPQPATTSNAASPKAKPNRSNPMPQALRRTRALRLPPTPNACLTAP